MPHDLDSNLLKEGDKVILHGVVTSVTEGEEYCNVTVQIPRKGETEVDALVTLNSKQVILKSSAFAKLFTDKDEV